jgi:putative membrane-bound dehydrogenase-like protein
MPADRAAAAFRVPNGYKVSVFASEPDVQNPIAMAWDGRGRLWIAENYTYAERSQRFDLSLRDRVVIFEDVDGDGKQDRRVVFTDEVQMLTSLEIGRGGVWLLCPPQLLFVPDRNRDDVPDGAPEVILDGFTVPAENYHNFANGLRWGPDGWLYGRCGASSPALLGPPGTPDDRRVPMGGGMWRYHPEKKRVEVLNHGTTNPWGHDWNEFGEPFFINTVNGHLWHAIAGAHFVRPHTIDPNPRTYELIDQHADHWHWDTAKDWSDSRSASGEHDRRGGGHAHSGMMIYLGDQWPESDRGKLFTLNFHGRRMNVERLERLGGGYVGKHEPDRFFAGDPWFRGIDLGYGPDGGVFVLDWSDTGECHEATGVHRTSGRIYKITYGTPTPSRIGDLARLSDSELVALLRHRNEWFARMARRELADRSVRGDKLQGVRESLQKWLVEDPDPVIRLRALWTLYGVGATDQDFLLKLLGQKHESVRAWAIRLLNDDLPIDTINSRRIGPVREVPLEKISQFMFMSLARKDESALVRLTLASTLQRLPVVHRMLAAPLLRHSEDASDHDIPLMLWYGLIPFADAYPEAFVRLIPACTIPTTRRLMSRRVAEDLERAPQLVEFLLDQTSRMDSRELQADVLNGVFEGLRGIRKAKKPAAWDTFAAKLEGSSDPAIRDRVRELSVVFGDGRALHEVKRLALDNKADLETRRVALKTLIENRPPDLRSICEKLLGVRFLNATAARGLALFDDPAVGRGLARSYRAFHPSERVAVIDTLVSRPAFASALLDEIAAGRIARNDLDAFHARQVRNLGDPVVSRRLGEVWGEIRDSAEAKRQEIARLKVRLSPETLAQADRSQGRVVYNKVCASCHKMYGHGGEIGPDLTGSGRDNLDYLLENMVDPSATVGADFRMSVLEMADGRVLNGLVRTRNDRTITLQTQTESLTLDRKDVEQIKQSPLSLMPEGLLDPLTPEQVRDLFGYLNQRTQAPLPADSK